MVEDKPLKGLIDFIRKNWEEVAKKAKVVRILIKKGGLEVLDSKGEETKPNRAIIL